MEKIEIKNNTRRPLMFRVPGRSIRLSPGGTLEIPRIYLEAQELKKLRLNHSISVLEEKPKKNIERITQIGKGAEQESKKQAEEEESKTEEGKRKKAYPRKEKIQED